MAWTCCLQFLINTTHRPSAWQLAVSCCRPQSILVTLEQGHPLLSLAMSEGSGGPGVSAPTNPPRNSCSSGCLSPRSVGDARELHPLAKVAGQSIWSTRSPAACFTWGRWVSEVTNTTTSNHLEEGLLDQAQVHAPYTPPFWGHSRTIPQGMVPDVQPLVKSSF